VADTVIMDFRYEIPCSFIDRYQGFEGTCWLHLQGRGDGIAEQKPVAVLLPAWSFLKDVRFFSQCYL
jgi:hypothetical protein